LVLPIYFILSGLILVLLASSQDKSQFAVNSLFLILPTVVIVTVSMFAIQILALIEHTPNPGKISWAAIITIPAYVGSMIFLFSPSIASAWILRSVLVRAKAK